MLSKKNKSSGLTYIADGTQITGDTEFSGDALVGGNLNGAISSKSTVTIEKSGTIEGELNCKEVSISGTFKGKLSCDRLVITSTGLFDGEARSDSIEIFEGGQFIGSRFSNQAIENNDAYNVTPIEKAQ
ncbi:polymer-forming cytoskeletal protein [Parashewanella curva]|uniref:Polymer-forming cytoskeletal protein n=1 Tax=Parashewanella curva TaxID=2338552 RepID=A0A3L8Q1K1_9GAMM|nr:polymer-forming cytoskeletal protein [Parashewanella curva]RLV61526.1 polymer-forming cytoskeletal protein [Parashewanella curva]